MSKTNNKSFILHLDSLSILDEMSNEQAGIFFKAIKEFKITGQLPDLEFGLKMAISPFINQFKRDEEKYGKIIERNKANIAKRWNTKNTTGKTGIPEIPLATKNTYNDNDNDSDNDNKNDNDKNNILLFDEFEEFWKSYIPVKTKKDGFVNKGSKEKAKIAFIKARKEHSFEKIMIALESYLLYCQKNNKFTKNVATWLNARDFEEQDEIVIKAQSTSRSDQTLINIMNFDSQ
jgi:Family of unknown function (DUF6291)